MTWWWSHSNHRKPRRKCQQIPAVVLWFQKRGWKWPVQHRTTKSEPCPSLDNFVAATNLPWHKQDWLVVDHPLSIHFCLVAIGTNVSKCSNFNRLTSIPSSLLFIARKFTAQLFHHPATLPDHGSWLFLRTWHTFAQSMFWRFKGLPSRLEGQDLLRTLYFWRDDGHNLL